MPCFVCELGSDSVGTLKAVKIKEGSKTQQVMACEYCCDKLNVDFSEEPTK